jgi:hypothetical protein
MHGWMRRKHHGFAESISYDKTETPAAIMSHASACIHISSKTSRSTPRSRERNDRLMMPIQIHDIGKESEKESDMHVMDGWW